MRRALLILLATTVAPAPLRAQLSFRLGDAIAQADLLYFAGDPLAAYEMLLDHVERNPDDYDALWRVARAGIVVGVSKVGAREQNQYLDPALHFARQAVETRPDDVNAVYWRGAAAGRRALNAAAGYGIELSGVVYDDAHAVLAVDSLHAGAHNMLGKLNFEVMSLSRIQRALARAFKGNDAIRDTSWENAETFLQRAVQLEPGNVLYHYDLGRLYAKRGRSSQAIDHLTHVAELPETQPIDRMLKADAETLLRDVKR